MRMKSSLVQDIRFIKAMAIRMAFECRGCSKSMLPVGYNISQNFYDTLSFSIRNLAQGLVLKVSLFWPHFSF